MKTGEIEIYRRLSIPYGVIGDLTTPDGRGATLETPHYCMLSNLIRVQLEEPELTGAQSPNTPLSVAPLISGLLLIEWTWLSIFWFLSKASPLVVLIMFLFLPETCRGLVGNGSRRTSCVNTPLIPVLRPERGSLLIVQQEKQKNVPKLPTPFRFSYYLKTVRL